MWVLEDAMNELETALSVAERYVPASNKSAFNAINLPLSKLEYAMRFMPHGEDYKGPLHLSPEDLEAFELVNSALRKLSEH
jgi:uncharacterized ferritin-like protein (DUF455 family)